jgi:mono/diheme cytochrome c family protein
LALILLIAVPVTFAGRPAAVPQAALTFSGDVARIIFNNCTACHRPGEAGPFSLLSYDDVRKRGKLIATVTQSRYMPPWHGDSQMATFRDDRRLTDAEIRTIQQWVQAGMPEGNPAKTPKPPQFTEGWQLGQPDLVVKMKEPFEIPADGPDVFRNFALQLNLTEDKWVKAIEFRSSAKASHHALFFIDPTGQAVKADGADKRPGFTGMTFLAGGLAGGNGVRGNGARAAQSEQRGQAGQFGGVGQILERLGRAGNSAGLGGWAVGGAPHFLPQGLARSLPKGSDLVLQMHFHPTGKIEHEQATVGFYFSKEPPKQTLAAIQLPPLFGALAGIDIPAGEKHFVIKDSFTLPVDADVIGGGAHAHYLATDMHMTATLPNSQAQQLLTIPNWQFNWQEGYFFNQPVRLPKGTRLDVEIAYDNSTANPNNPANPPRHVRFGQQSTDEMGAMTIEIVPVRESDLPEYRAAMAQHVLTSVLGGLGNLQNLGGRGRRQ